jgi:opacity protein-like surface antigen
MFKTKIFVSTAMMLLFSVCLMAQSSKWNIGIEAGPAISSVRGNDVLKNKHKSRLGAAAGISLQYKLSDKFSLKSALLYEIKGSKAEVTYFDNNGNTTGIANNIFDYQYLSVPLLCRATFGKSIKYFVNAGPYVSVLLISQQSGPEQDFNTIANYKNYDAGLAAGAGIVYPLKGNLTVSAELRNQVGLVNVSSIPIQNNGSIKHNSAQLLFGIQYAL